MAQEESVAVTDEQMLETDIQLEVNDVSAEGEEMPEATDEAQQTAEEPAVRFDEIVLIDGQPAPIEIGRIQKNGTSYVSLAAMAKALDENAAVAWDGSTGTVTVTTANLTMTARLGEYYVIACGCPANTGDPQIYRHFGIEPKLFDLVEVKANTSYRLPFSAFASVMCTVDVPGCVGVSDLKSLPFKKIPRPFYPFDEMDGYQVGRAICYG